MLVLGRRLNEKLVLPSIPATIQVVAIQGGTVRLGVEAPPEVPVLREEICPTEVTTGPRDGAAEARKGGGRHVLRNMLNNLGLGLALLERQLPAIASEELRETLRHMKQDFQTLLQQIHSPGPEDKGVLTGPSSCQGQTA